MSIPFTCNSKGCKRFGSYRIWFNSKENIIKPYTDYFCRKHIPREYSLLVVMDGIWNIFTSEYEDYLSELSGVSWELDE